MSMQKCSKKNPIKENKGARHSSRNIDSENEEKTSDEEITSHNNSRTGSEKKLQQTFQSRNSHSTENSSEESEEEGQEIKRVRRRTKKIITTEKCVKEESNKRSEEL